MIILDGWGLGPATEANPVYIVNPEKFNWLAENYPMTSLQASGISVGLPWGDVGNSEVGHLTLGAGKIIYQYFPRITMAIQDETFFSNPALVSAMEHAEKNKTAVNLVGLLTKATVHASLDHLLALIELAKKKQIPFKLHLFADGKDGPPHSLEELLEKIPMENLATLTGRYYAMDRTKKWMLTGRAYECLVGEGGNLVHDLGATIRETYAKGFTEEFIPPLRLKPDGAIKDNESLIFFNFREDSMRQLVEAFAGDLPQLLRKRIANLKLVTMTRYEESLNLDVAFPPEGVLEPLGKVLSDAGKTQLRLAETYKYAHVTFFFNGHRESPFKNEYRVLIPSLAIPHPDERPELMAAAVSDRIIDSVQNNAFDFVLANYSNPDTIAHTGNYEAALEAVKVIDREIGRVLDAVLKTDTVLIITSDHGNIETLFDPLSGRAETGHNPSPVPFYLIGREFKGRRFVNWPNLAQETGGLLADVAPTILELMGIPKPEDMNGRSLLKELMH